jgi:hypothetical protein
METTKGTWTPPQSEHPLPPPKRGLSSSIGAGKRQQQAADELASAINAAIHAAIAESRYRVHVLKAGSSASLDEYGFPVLAGNYSVVITGTKDNVIAPPVPQDGTEI